jgi:carbonic anhydrase
VQAVAETNAKLAARMLLERSPTMSELVDAGSLKVVAAMHDIGTGRVMLLG